MKPTKKLMKYLFEFGFNPQTKTYLTLCGYNLEKQNFKICYTNVLKSFKVIFQNHHKNKQKIKKHLILNLRLLNLPKLPLIHAPLKCVKLL